MANLFSVIVVIREHGFIHFFFSIFRINPVGALNFECKDEFADDLLLISYWHLFFLSANNNRNKVRVIFNIFFKDSSTKLVVRQSNIMFVAVNFLASLNIHVFM